MSTPESSPTVTPANPSPQPMTEQELETYRLHRRFDRMGRLIGDEKMKRLMGAHVIVLGLGGVGSWAAEMLIRSGVGRLTLVDFDEICITNFNRQLHALQGNVGQQKVDVVAERLQKINPQAQIRPIARFFNQDSCDELMAERPDFIIDAIDSVTSKCMLLAFCHANEIPVVSSTGSAGRMDPTQIRVSDLADTEFDPLARVVRRILRQQYGFRENRKFRIPAVFSAEAPSAPEELNYDHGKGFRCVCPQGDNPYFNCDNRNLIMGSAGFVTAAFGMACASHVVRELCAVAGVDLELRRRKKVKPLTELFPHLLGRLPSEAESASP